MQLGQEGGPDKVKAQANRACGGKERKMAISLNNDKDTKIPGRQIIHPYRIVGRWKRTHSEVKNRAASTYIDSTDEFLLAATHNTYTEWRNR